MVSFVNCKPFHPFPPPPPYVPRPTHAVPYLTDVKGFSREVVTNTIFPVSIYASLLFFVVAGPVSHALGAKSFVVLGAMCKLATRTLLIWGDSLGAMQLMQVLYAAGSASELILFAYVYSVTEPGAYQTVTGAVSAASLAGYMTAAEIGQLAFEAGASYESLFYFSFAAVGVAAMLSIALPSPPKQRTLPMTTMTRARTTASNTSTGTWRGTGTGTRAGTRAGSSSPSGCGGGGGVFDFDWRECKRQASRAAAWSREALDACYGSTSLLVLSTWWILGVAPAQFIENYGTNLFDAIDPSSDVNGHIAFAVRALMTMASALAAVAGPRVAGEPWTYAFASAGAAAAAWTMAGSKSLPAAGTAYCAAVTAIQGATCLVYSQSALAMDALAASRRTPSVGGMMRVISSSAAAAGSAAGGSAGADVVEWEREGGEGDERGNEDEDRDGDDGGIGGGGDAASPSLLSGDHALLFGANGALSLVALTVLQGIVDAARIDIRGEFAVVAGWCMVAGASVLLGASARMALRGSWSLNPTGGDLIGGDAAGRAHEEEDEGEEGDEGGFGGDRTSANDRRGLLNAA